MVIDKPAGLAVHGGMGVSDRDSLRGAILDAFAVEPGFDGPSFLGRLDRPTSGLVAACLSKSALAMLLPPWSAGAIKKEYLVLVHGKAKDAGDIDIPLAARRAQDKGSGKKEEARTSYRKLAGNAHASLVVAELHTGRTHQIRRHMKAIGHPLLGDTRYGDERRAKDLPDGAQRGLMLHAWRLSHTGDVPLLPKSIEAPMPTRFRDALRALELLVTLPRADVR